MTAPDAHNRPASGDAPVTTLDADALDAWLESITGQPTLSFRGTRQRRAAERYLRSRPGANGHGDPATSLPAAAEHFHARLARAEREAQPDVPVDAIWEKIMASPTIAPAPRHHAGRAAELVSARSPRRDTPRVVPAWLAGSHWLVSAFMVAAVVVGIVALYGSFAGAPGGSSDDDGTNPGFAMASPGGTDSTPEPDIDRWLADFSSIDCERDPNSSLYSGDWATDRPTARDDYLPFAAASASDADVIADRWFYLNADCAATDDDPLVTDDFGWMPGVGGGVIPSKEQIALAQEISTALPIQDHASYYIIRKPVSEATPDVNAELGGRGVLLPEDIVQLPDGRVGGPLRFLIHTNDRDFDITDYTEGYEAAGTPFILFEQVDGRWLYDELITVCVGDCDWFWTEFANPDAVSGPTTYATPAGATPSANADWLAPASPEECVVEPRALDDVAAFMQDPGATVPREYGPVEPVSDELAVEVARANRVFHSCNLTSGPQDWRAMVSPRLIFEGKGSPTFDSIVARSATYEDYVANHRELSEMLIDPTRDYTVVSTQAQPVLADGRADYSETYAYDSVLLPEDLVALPDGRVGGPMLMMRPVNHEEILQAEIDAGITRPTPPNYQMVTYRIYAQDPTHNGAWMLDETLTLCASGCDAYFAVAEEYYRSTLPITPAATPSASPPAVASEAAMDWLAPVTPEECNLTETRDLEEVGAIVNDAGRAAPREYGPVTGVEESVAQDVAGANRAWESCRAQGLIAERRAVESLRYIAEIEPYNLVAMQNSASYDDWVALNETLRAAFLDPDAESYLVESAALPPFDCETGYGDAVPSGELFFDIILPQHLVRLPDGRIGGPVTSLVGPGFLQCLETRPPARNSGFQVAYIHVLAQDPTRDNRWALDERFRVCVSGCDDYYEETAFLSSYMYPPWPATPEAASTDAGATSLQPISPDECDVEPLSDGEVAAITQGEPGDEAERSYAPVGPVDAALAADVVAADRAWQSCYVNGSAGQRAALQTARLTRDGPGVLPGFEQTEDEFRAQLDRFDATRELGETMLSGDWRDYFIESDLFDAATPAPLQITGFIATVPNPEGAVQLADGRVAVPIVELLPPDAYPLSVSDADDIPHWYIEVHILAPDPAGDGRWLFDESIPVCMGDCDLARADTVAYLASIGIVVDGATPAATPQARRDGGAA